MIPKRLVFLPPTVLGLIILFTSILRAPSIKYDFEPTPAPTSSIVTTSTLYTLPNKTLIAPDSPLWPAAVGMERVTLTLSFGRVKKSEQLLAMADKRLIAAVELFEKGNPELGLSVLTKAEKYIEQSFNVAMEANEKGENTTTLVQKLTNASFTHKKVMDDLTFISPETARPIIVLTSNISQTIYLQLQDQVATLSQNTNF